MSMSAAKEIRNRISSVKDTAKVTDAMYMIASTKLRKMRRNLEATEPYFEEVRNEIKRVFRVDSDIESRYFYPKNKEDDLPPPYGYLVITSDRGLAGIYNRAVIRKAENAMAEHGEGPLFVVGEYGRQYFNKSDILPVQDFIFSAEDPTVERARIITRRLLELYDSQQINKLYLIYTDMKNPNSCEVRADRLLPFHRKDFHNSQEGTNEGTDFEFIPSISEVLNHGIVDYLTGYIYSAMVDSFCCEEDARMRAMDEAGKNASELIKELSRQYNHVRQGAITSQITETAAGARAMKAISEKRASKSSCKL